MYVQPRRDHRRRAVGRGNWREKWVTRASVCDCQQDSLVQSSSSERVVVEDAVVACQTPEDDVSRSPVNTPVKASPYPIKRRRSSANLTLLHSKVIKRRRDNFFFSFLIRLAKRCSTPWGDRRLLRVRHSRLALSNSLQKPHSCQSFSSQALPPGRYAPVHALPHEPRHLHPSKLKCALTRAIPPHLSLNEVRARRRPHRTHRTRRLPQTRLLLALVQKMVHPLRHLRRPGLHEPQRLALRQRRAPAV